MFIGEYYHNLDDKKRLIMPAKFRNELGDKIIVTKGLDGCLFGYSLSTWNLITNKLKALPFTKRSARTFTRIFLSGASICEFDKQGRITLTTSLIEYADIQKECAIIGVNDRLEIWSLKKLRNELNDNETKLAELTENLFDDGEEYAY